jgi:hypothetical protein
MVREAERYSESESERDIYLGRESERKTEGERAIHSGLESSQCYFNKRPYASVKFFELLNAKNADSASLDQLTFFDRSKKTFSNKFPISLPDLGVQCLSSQKTNYVHVN